jgi:hypothetical protein
MTGGWQRGVLVAGPETSPTGSLVLKIGGSLLTLPDWPARINDLVDDVRPRAGRVIIVVGGGPIVDGLRAIDAAAPQAAELMHRLAIEALQLSASLVGAALGLPLARAPGTWAACVLDTNAWLADAGGHRDLPVGWEVTSDSIAAVVAAAHDGRLMLAKRVPPPGGLTDLAALAQAGWIDEHFPNAACGLKAIAWAAACDDDR